MPLNGQTVLGEVLSRCKRIPGVDLVVCTVPTSPENDLVAELASTYCRVVIGPEQDVLGRYLLAAKVVDADIIMRITADCPLISPELCGQVLKARTKANADYASNIEPRTFPQGFDCEVFTFETLKKADEQSEEREHVTTWMRQSKEVKRVNVKSPWPLEGRLTLDTWEDYIVICAAFGHEPYQRLRAA